MRITVLALDRATLGRQLLLRRESLDVVDAVRRVVALQAQHPASPYLALWNRLSCFDPADLDAVVEGYTVVKATLMRMTWHAVHADDYPAFRAAMEPTLRATLLNRLTAAIGFTLGEADRLVADLSFRQRPSYVAAGPPTLPVDADAAAESLQVLVRRYLEGFGPASVADMAKFALVQQARGRPRTPPPRRD